MLFRVTVMDIIPNGPAVMPERGAAVHQHGRSIVRSDEEVDRQAAQQDRCRYQQGRQRTVKADHPVNGTAEGPHHDRPGLSPRFIIRLLLKALFNLRQGIPDVIEAVIPSGCLLCRAA